jgi:hypothetical protein
MTEWARKNLSQAEVEETIGLNTLINYAQLSFGVGYPIAKDYARVVILRLRNLKTTSLTPTLLSSGLEASKGV